MSNVTESLRYIRDYNGIELDEVAARYREPHRVYHGLDHIEHMLGAVEKMAERFGLSESGRYHLHVATWYHDAIYVVGSQTNEEDSAYLALADSFAMTIHDMVLVTKTHRNPRTFYEAMMIDADLAGLGSPAYYANCLKVRAEYFPGHPGVGDNMLWLEGRKKFLTAYLGRPNIYYTSWGAEYELPARHNMEQELRALESL